MLLKRLNWALLITAIGAGTSINFRLYSYPLTTTCSSMSDVSVVLDCSCATSDEAMVIERIVVKMTLIAAHIIFVKLAPFIFAIQLLLFLSNDHEGLHRSCITVYFFHKLVGTGFMEPEEGCSICT